MSGLPIEAALPALADALRTAKMAVLQAPPGAGKTTRVPLFLIEETLIDGKILMLEPRRLAARAAAERMAETLGETAGQTVGYRMRGDSKSSPETRIEVITEGILTRMIQSDPELTGIGCIIFDEFHERSLQSDTGLAFTLEVREALRPDLHLIVMSATLDAAPVAKLIGDAPMVTSEGRSFPVESRHLPKPWAKPNTHGPRFENAMADLIAQAAKETTGGILAFLPGEGEIRRTEAVLQNALPADCILRPLYGGLPFAEQRRAVLPEKQGRKVVLATSIAETSLTIQDVRVVVDGGRARRARFDAGSGMSRLITDRVTKAEATQRMGRAGRVAQGICYKLWTKGEEGGLAPFPLPEILSADIASLILELAAWGTSDPQTLPFLDHPRDADVAQAQALLRSLGALDADNRITPHGTALARHPLHPRLAHMLEHGGPDAPLLAALIESRDPLPRTAPSDLSLRLEALKDPHAFANTRPFKTNAGTIKSIKHEAKRLKHTPSSLSLAETLALAYPDRIGLRRKGDAPRFVLSGGKGAVFRDDDPTGANRLIIATNLDGDAREAKVRAALPITQAELANVYGDQFEDVNICEWSKRDRRVLTRKRTQFGQLVLDDQNWKDCPPDASNAAMCDGIRDLGLQCLPWSDAATLFRARVEWLRAQDHALPDFSDTALLETLTDWLEPHLTGIRAPDGLKKLDLLTILRNILSWEAQQTLDQLAPASITAPTGTKLPIDYGAAQPKIAVRLQELFGMTTHPTAGPKRLPLLIELLSPARRPVQTTADLPNFWSTSYADVRKDMRGRYPRHPWPEDPTQAEPTRRVKPRN
ncbi:ATP-dependent helicase HrpB [Amylibacter sp. IMCC11727]|uniref:ATP-dependent helicase HrpB n=1 Tax=Amylibacter sp. IMCC11727 TaxID=3039851 RepID=UPI00244E07B8|nr:ATP-dependent helicase HrpB [Amylibacter sp. IMCC11727]WGI22939.1 ATP-dependent helicase HrpB [Amylibacter sp. IMCC11727]